MNRILIGILAAGTLALLPTGGPGPVNGPERTRAGTPRTCTTGRPSR